MQYVELNDVFFNQNTALMLDDNSEKIIDTIDGAKLISKFKMRSKFNETVLDVDKLSAGCKTVLNVLYNPDKVFCLKECGNNALEILYDFQSGYVYSDYALIPFDMDGVNVQSSSGKKEIHDYEELKEWWSYEE
jgi:hypothetical protein